MVDRLLPYYNRELTYIRRMAAEFAEQHPRIAGHLRITADAVEDPHVSRMIEGFAYLAARVRLKLDDEFPELTDALLAILYPHYVAPTPSMAIVQFQPQPDQSGAYELPAGAALSSEPISGAECQFRTAYPVTLWPVEITAAALTGRPLVAPANPRAGSALASLRLTLSCLAAEATFTDLAPDRLRFFLRGQPSQVFELYELILNNAIGVALADGPGDDKAAILGPEAIKPVGFGLDEGVLPYPARSFPGYRLLTEYFTFPEKFLFFDVEGLSAKTLLQAGQTLDVFIYLDRTSAELERSLSAENFALGCTPIVNLFRQRAEPIQLTRTESEYRVVPDARRPKAMEVYSIDRVTATRPDGSITEFTPFHSVKHLASDGAAAAAFWCSARRPAGGRQSGDEVYLSLVDLDFNPAAPADCVASVETTCVNRDLPADLPYGGGRPRLRLVDGGAIRGVECLTPPTPTLRANLGAGGYWRLISHLALNHMSLVGEDALDALQEILKIYDFRDSADTRAAIASIISLGARSMSARAPDADGAFCRGVEIAIEFDDKRFSSAGLYLMAAVLERFFGLYCSINSFTRTVARVRGRQEALRRWPPRAGTRVLV